MKTGQRRFYRIKEVAQLTGFDAFTLRNWESRIGFPIPTRTEGGQRRYGEAEIFALRLIRSHYVEGATPGELKKKYEDAKNLFYQNGETSSRHLLDDRGSFSSLSSNRAIYFDSNVIPEPLLLDELFHALGRFDESAASLICQKFVAETSPLVLMEHVFAPLLRRIGDAWNQGTWGIVQEHFATYFLRSKLERLISNLPINPNGIRVVLLTSEGEQHEGGLLLVSAALKLGGLSPVYLGASIPIGELSKVLSRISYDLIGVSYVRPEHFLSDLPELSQIPSKVIVGGRGVDNLEVSPPLYRVSVPLADLPRCFIDIYQKF